MDAISKRTKAALEAAKTRGKVMGGRRVSAERFREIAAQGRKERITRVAISLAKPLPIMKSIQAQGAKTLHQIAAELNAQSIPTPRNGEWSAVQVSRVIQLA